MTLLTNLAIKAANSPSTFVSNDRATNSGTHEKYQQTTDSTCSRPRLPSILATSAASPTGSVQSLQAKLLAARKKNELLEEIERGVDKDGYPFCEYRKGFGDHLQGKALIISVSDDF